MKLNGIVGKGSGKLGASVFAISGGEQIVRQYNPQVSNPNTDAQVAQRAKLKLMSQLAAALAPGLGFKKLGLVSARNQFVSKNIGICTFTNGEAAIPLTDIQLTAGSLAAPLLEVERITGTANISVDMDNEGNANFSHIVLVSAERDENKALRLIEVKVVEKPDSSGYTNVTITGTDKACLVYGYGVLTGSAKIRSTYGDAIVGTGAQDAILTTDIMASVRNGSLSATDCEEIAANA